MTMVEVFRCMKWMDQIMEGENVCIGLVVWRNKGSYCFGFMQVFPRTKLLWLDPCKVGWFGVGVWLWKMRGLDMVFGEGEKESPPLKMCVLFGFNGASMDGWRERTERE